MGEAAAEAALAALEGIDVGIEEEVIAPAAHADAGLQPRIPARPPVMHAGRDHGFGGLRVVPRDGEFLHLAIGNGGVDVVDAGTAVVARIAHRGLVELRVVLDLALLTAGIMDGARQRRRLGDRREIRQGPDAISAGRTGKVARLSPLQSVSVAASGEGTTMGQ